VFSDLAEQVPVPRRPMKLSAVLITVRIISVSMETVASVERAVVNVAVAGRAREEALCIVSSGGRLVGRTTRLS
jgi:hypothetical protein